MRVRPEVSELSVGRRDPDQRLRGPGAHHPPRRDHGRARLRPELHDRRPAPATAATTTIEQDALPRQPADHRRPVPLEQLPPQRDRAGDRRHALSGQAGQREPDRASDRRLSAAPTPAERVFLGTSEYGQPRRPPADADHGPAADARPGHRRRRGAPLPRPGGRRRSGAPQAAAGDPAASRPPPPPASASDRVERTVINGPQQVPRRPRRDRRRSSACSPPADARRAAARPGARASTRSTSRSSQRTDYRARPRRPGRRPVGAPSAAASTPGSSRSASAMATMSSSTRPRRRRRHARDVATRRGRIRPAAQRRRSGHRRRGPAGHGPGHRQPQHRLAFPTARTGQARGGPSSTSSNYGCAVNSNLAAMIADPTDLVLGQAGSVTGDADTSSKAIKVYRRPRRPGPRASSDVSTRAGN